MKLRFLISTLCLILLIFAASCSRPLSVYVDPQLANMRQYIDPELVLVDDRTDADISITGSRIPASKYKKDPLCFIQSQEYEVAAGALSIRDPEIKDLSEIPEGIKITQLCEIPKGLRIFPVNGLLPENKNYPFRYFNIVTIDFDINKSETLSGPSETLVQALSVHFAITPKPAKFIWVSAVGDMILSRGVDRSLRKDPERVFTDTISVLSESDLALGNLEGALTFSTKATPKSFNFKFDPRLLPELRKAGFDYVSITNNHSFDFGLTGFIDTMKFLGQSEIAFSGGGMNLESAVLPANFEINEELLEVYSLGAYPQEKNGFSGLKQASAGPDSPGILWAKEDHLELLRNRLSQNRERIQIVMVHGGQEWASIPTANQKQLYRSLIDAGADAVFSSHPHVLQGMEAWKSGYIFYSLGNFLFPGMQGMPHAEESMIAQIGFYENTPVALRLHPARLNGRTVGLSKDEDAEYIIKRFYQLSQNIIKE